MSLSREHVAKLPGVRSLRRAQTDDTPEFDLAYVRGQPGQSTPVVVIPGGPGLASVFLYQMFRQRAAKRGLDVIMIEHRGVGLSRTDSAGTDLPPSAVTIRAAVDDIAAVLDAEGVERAIIYGSSYGSYLAQAFGAWYPTRVAGMVLDSPMVGAGEHAVIRAHAQALLWDGSNPRTAAAAKLLRELVADGVITADEGSRIARVVYEFAGEKTLERLLRARRAGGAGRTWRWIAKLGEQETERVSPFVSEFDLVGRIAFRELDFAAKDFEDGPFNPAGGFRELSQRFDHFEGEPLTLPDEWAAFDWPVAVVSGERDLRTPRPLAERVASGVPDGALVPLSATGHSALDTHLEASFAAIEAIRDGTHHELGSDQSRLSRLPRRGLSRHLATIIRARLFLETLLTGHLRRSMR